MSDIIKELRNAAMLENDDGRRHLAGLLSKAADELAMALSHRAQADVKAQNTALRDALINASNRIHKARLMYGKGRHVDVEVQLSEGLSEVQLALSKS